MRAFAARAGRCACERSWPLHLHLAARHGRCVSFKLARDALSSCNARMVARIWFAGVHATSVSVVELRIREIMTGRCAAYAMNFALQTTTMTTARVLVWPRG